MARKKSEPEQVQTDPLYDVKGHERHPGYLIRRLHQIAISLFLDRMRDTAITPLQYTILRIVARHSGWNQKMIATCAVLDTSTTHDIVLRLETKGFVTRTGGIKDRRMRAVFITESGREALAAAEKVVQSAQSELLAPLPEHAQASFLNMLKVLVEANVQMRQGEAGPGPWRRHTAALAAGRLRR